jgi:SAM-dependent methyltransferase
MPDALRRCPACGAALTGRPARLPAGYVSCTGCSLGHLEVLPDAPAAAARFGPRYFAGDEAGHYPDYAADEAVHRRNSRRVLDRLATARGPGAQLLDVGCGYGFLLDEARREGWGVAGVDVSEHARAQTRARVGVDVAPDIASVPGSGPRFAAATAVQVLHHAVDPGEMLDDVAARLVPGGLLALETVDRGAAVARALGRRWPLPAAPWTVWLFDRPSLGSLLGRCGFSLLDVRPSRKRISLHHLLGAGSARGAGASQRLRRAARGRIGRLAVTYPFADTILVLARRSPA